MGKESSDILPGKISSITPQKNDHSRVSIFVDDQFLIGISESTFSNFNLSKGTEITVSLYEQLLDAENRDSIKAHSYRLLSRRDHSRTELYRKLKKKEDYPDFMISDVLDELEQKKYLDDSDFAYKFAAEKARLNRWGPVKIRSKLIQKGIKRADIDTGIRQAFGDIDLHDTLAELVRKNSRKFKREPDPFKRKKKIFDYLKRKGYTSETITRYLDKLVNSVS